ncbi:MAG: prolyl oligopeptidase family serine peptidase [Terracidiphilus sp.]|jgi:prolyl oligopeptidase
MQLSAFPPEPVIEILHGVPVVDPFRWLEDRSSEKTSSWIAEQQYLHDAYFAGFAPLDAIRSRVSAYLDFEKIDQPVRLDNHFVYRRRRKHQEQPCICVRDRATDEERILVDPSVQGPFASVAIHRVSEDGSLLAYELRHGGSDSNEIHIVDTKNGRVLPDYLPVGYARGFVFSPDRSGFYYSHDQMSLTDEHTIRFHQFGATANAPILFRAPRTPRSRLLLSADSTRLGATYVREDGADLRIDFHIAQHNLHTQWKPVFTNQLAPYWPILHHGRVFVWTEDRAPNGKLIEVGIDGITLRVVIPEGEVPIRQIARAGDRFYVPYLVDRQWIIRSWTLDGVSTRTLPLPAHGTVQMLPGLSAQSQSLFYCYESFTDPLRLCEYRPESGTTMPTTESLPSLGLEHVRVHEVWFHSKDGTRIPMSLVMRHDLAPSTPQPAILTGYGGFGAAMTPQFSVLVAILVELGAIFALPSIRGGGEFGKAWHEAGRGRHRQVAIDDFIGAAEWLAGWNTTSPRLVGAFGGSNGGLLVAAAMTQRPDLFQAVLCIAPLLDMVRHERFDQARKWRQEYGTVDDAEDFDALYRYSPYHRIQDDVNYPAILFVTGDRDDRCNPAHVRKMAARLQSRPAQTNSILVDYSAERGHVPVLPLSVRIDALFRRVGFLANELRLPISQGGRRETPGD